MYTFQLLKKIYSVLIYMYINVTWCMRFKWVFYSAFIIYAPKKEESCTRCWPHLFKKFFMSCLVITSFPTKLTSNLLHLMYPYPERGAKTKLRDRDIMSRLLGRLWNDHQISSEKIKTKHVLLRFFIPKKSLKRWNSCLNASVTKQ